jgi:hypothetical protein
MYVQSRRSDILAGLGRGGRRIKVVAGGRWRWVIVVRVRSSSDREYSTRYIGKARFIRTPWSYFRKFGTRNRRINELTGPSRHVRVQNFQQVTGTARLKKFLFLFLFLFYFYFNYENNGSNGRT